MRPVYGLSGYLSAGYKGLKLCQLKLQLFLRAVVFKEYVTIKPT